MFKPVVDCAYFKLGLNHRSMIDFPLVSSGSSPDVKAFRIIDNGNNLSDHFPIAIMFQGEQYSNDGVLFGSEKNINNHKPDGKLLTKPRWDHAHLLIPCNVM